MNSQLFFFNPTNEMAIANGCNSYMPPSHLRKFEEDLATLPWILGTNKDYILVKKIAGNSLSHLTNIGWNVPTPVTGPSEITSTYNQEGLIFSPWGWSPAVYRHFKPFEKLAASQWQNHPLKKWNVQAAHLLSRETGYKLLETVGRINSEIKNANSCIYIPPPPMRITNRKELLNILTEFPPPLVIKTPWSASGRGLFRIRDKSDGPEKSSWVTGMLRKQGTLYVEKMLNKIQDVSFQFMIEKDNIKYLGHNFFYTDPSGQFAGCAIGHPDTLNTLFDDDRSINTAINTASQILKQGIEELNIDKYYKGPAGVDGIFFEDENGLLKLQPCLEINLRYNMGLANIYLKDRIHPNASGLWKTGVFKKAEWKQFCEVNSQKKILNFVDGKLCQGFLPFVEPDENKQFGAWLDLK